MSKLRTPVRYGSEIKDIEFTKFLELSDTAKSVLSLPVGIKTPAKDRGIAAGKLLRCDNNGALVTGNCFGYTDIITNDFSLDNANAFVDIVFTKTIYMIRFACSYYDNLDYLYWTNSSHDAVLQNLGKSGLMTILFRGKAVSIGAAFTDEGDVDFDIWAYY